MTTNTKPSTPPLDRLAGTFQQEPQPRRATPAARSPLSAEQRLAASYAPTPSPVSTDTRRPVARPPSLPEERLARAYEAEKPAIAQQNAADDDDDEDDVLDDEQDRAQHDVDDDDDATESTDDDDADEQSEAPFEFEGLDDKATATALSEVARELKLDNKAAQKIVDTMQPVLNERAVRQVRAIVDGWEKETKSDPEIGGARLKETISLANRALDAFGSDELRKLLGPMSAGGTNLGSNKAVLRFLAKVGRVAAVDRAPKKR